MPPAKKASPWKPFTEGFVGYVPKLLIAAVAAIVVMYFDVRDHSTRITELEKKTEAVQVIAANVDNLEKTMNDKFALLMDLVKGVRDDIKSR